MGQKHNAKCFGPGELRSAKYKPLEQNVKAKRGGESSKTQQTPRSERRKRRKTRGSQKMKSPSLFAAAAC